MKLIHIREIPAITPPKHHHMKSRWVVDETIGAKTMRVSLGQITPASEVETHVHLSEEQLFIVLKGELINRNEKEEVRTKPGGAVLVFPGEPHATFTESPECEYLVITGFQYK
jgi:quercetin dioxygenase-like cupin family protein